MTDPKKLAAEMIAAEDPDAMPEPPVQGEEEPFEDFARRQEQYEQALALYHAHYEDDEETRVENARLAAEAENAAAEAAVSPDG